MKSGLPILNFVLVIICLVIACTSLAFAVVNTNRSISNDDLLTQSSDNIPNYIVTRDDKGNFKTNMISTEGVAENSTDVVNKDYVDTKFVTNNTSSVDKCLASFDGTSGKIIQDTGIISTDVVTNNSSSGDNHLASFVGTSGKIIQNTSIVSTDVVTNSGVSTLNSIAIFTDTDGKIISDSKTTVSQLVPYQNATANVDLGNFTTICKTNQYPVLANNAMKAYGTVIPNNTGGFASFMTAGSIDNFFSYPIGYFTNNKASVRFTATLEAVGSGPITVTMQFTTNISTVLSTVSVVYNASEITKIVIEAVPRNTNDCYTTMTLIRQNGLAPIVVSSPTSATFNKAFSQTFDFTGGVVGTGATIKCNQAYMETIYSS
jgi:hypothetical protein